VLAGGFRDGIGCEVKIIDLRKCVEIVIRLFPLLPSVLDGITAEK
jgi:hypothetical protein